MRKYMDTKTVNYINRLIESISVDGDYWWRLRGDGGYEVMFENDGGMITLHFPANWQPPVYKESEIADEYLAD